MRNLMSYLIAGVFVVLALDMVAPPVGLGFSPVGASTVSVGDSNIQTVDRSNKSDRISVSIVGKRQPDAPIGPRMMAGCDPAFSPLAASARVNFARSCVG